MVTKGKENRYQIRSIAGYGEAHGVRVRYSPVRYDRENTGSGDAVLTNMDYFDIRDTAFVFPTDSVLDIDLPAMLAAHRETHAVVTIAAAHQPAEIIAHRYGLLDADENNRVRGFVEKPSLQQIYQHYGVTPGMAASLPSLPTNAGFYLMDAVTLREISRHPDIVAMRKHKLDIGGDLLPWLTAHGHPVYAHQIGRMGDLGNISSYLETMVDVLHGRFHSLLSFMPAPLPHDPQVMIDEETLRMPDTRSGLTLAEKLERGLVTLNPPVRIGRYVEIGTGVTLSECNIDDDCEIGHDSTILRSSIGAGSIFGPRCHVEDTLTGIMVELQSNEHQPITLQRFVAIGDEVVIRAGVELRDAVTIHPRLKVPSGANIPANTDIESAEQLLEYL